MKKWLLAIFILLSSPSYALEVIRDEEIEVAIQNITEPIFKAANLGSKDVSIVLINDPELNAYVSGGKNIFLHTGIITFSENPAVLMGVIAHETGHITGGHLIRKRREFEQSMLENIVTTVLGVAVGVASQSGTATHAIISGGSQLALSQYLQYSRSYEEAADQAGMVYLSKAGFSSGGILELLHALKHEQKIAFGKINPYLQTHPLTEERIRFVEEALKTQSSNAKPLPESLSKPYKIAVIKLKAFLNEPKATLLNYPASDISEEACYSRAIAYYKLSEINKSLAEIDNLIKKTSNNPYYHELKGQVLYEYGKPKEAIIHYEKALKYKPDSALIRSGLAAAIIASDIKSDLPRAIKKLEEASAKEPDNSYIYRLLATAYGKKGDDGMAKLALAKEADVIGEKEDAVKFANAAVKKLPEDSSALLKAQDIIAGNKDAKKK